MDYQFYLPFVTDFVAINTWKLSIWKVKQALDNEYIA